MARRILVTGINGLIGKRLLNSEELNFLASDTEIDILKPRGPELVIKKALEMNCHEILHLAWTSNSSQDYDSSSLHQAWRIQSFKMAIEAQEQKLAISLVGTGLDSNPFSKSAYIREKSLLKISLSPLINKKEILWIRPFYLVDILERRPRIIRELIDSGIGGFSMQSGNSKQDYILASDVASAISYLLENRVLGAVDIGSGSLTRNIDLCRAVAEKLDFPMPTDRELDMPIAGPTADIVQLLQLGWLPAETSKLLNGES